MSLMMFLLLAFVNSKADSADLMILKANVDSYRESILEIKEQLREIRQDLKDMSRKKWIMIMLKYIRTKTKNL